MRFWVGLAAFFTLLTLGLGIGYLVYFDNADAGYVTPFVVAVRSNGAFVAAGSVFLALGVVACVVGLVTKMRGPLILAIAFIFSVACLMTPQASGSLGIQLIGVLTVISALITAWCIWRVSENLQEESTFAGGFAIERMHKIRWSVKTTRMVALLLAALNFVGSLILIIVGCVQSYPQTPSSKAWNLTAGFVGITVGVLLFLGTQRYTRSVLILAATFAFFQINLYASWIGVVQYMTGRLDDCDDAAIALTLSGCSESGLWHAELAFNWINWIVSILCLGACVLLSEKLQSWHEAEAFDVDRNLSGPTRIVGIKVHAPIGRFRTILAALLGLLLLCFMVLLTSGALAAANGYAQPSIVSPCNDPIIAGMFVLVAVMAGAFGLAKLSRTALMGCMLIMAWLTAYTFNFMVQQIIALLDGMMTSLVPPVYTQLTGYAAGVSTILAVFCGLVCLFSLIAVFVVYILLEAMQDASVFGAWSFRQPINFELMIYPAPSNTPIQAPYY